VQSLREVVRPARYAAAFQLLADNGLACTFEPVTALVEALLALAPGGGAGEEELELADRVMGGDGEAEAEAEAEPVSDSEPEPEPAAEVEAEAGALVEAAARLLSNPAAEAADYVEAAALFTAALAAAPVCGSTTPATPAQQTWPRMTRDRVPPQGNGSAAYGLEQARRAQAALAGRGLPDEVPRCALRAAIQ
jgi:hypothetical protein